MWLGWTSQLDTATERECLGMWLVGTPATGQ